MALNLRYPLKKGTYHRVRGFASHVRSHPGTWYGIDDGCPIGTPLIAMSGGKISHAARRPTGGGYSFLLNFTRYPGWSAWYAHCSSIPSNGRTFKQGQVIGKSGATGAVSGAHLHYSILHKFVPKNPDNKNVVKWIVKDPMTAAKTIFKNVFITVMARWPTSGEINTYLKSKEKRPYTYVQKKFLPKRYISISSYKNLLKKLNNNYIPKKVHQQALADAQKEHDRVTKQVAVDTAKEYQLVIDKLQKKLQTCINKPKVVPKPSEKPSASLLTPYAQGFIKWLKRKLHVGP